MSTTRHASEGSQFRQERYMSSPEMQRGLLANCVAARVQALADPLHRRLIWWLQKVSWMAGGLEHLANEIMQRWPERFATATMQKLGTGPDRVYSAEKAEAARDSLPMSKAGWGVGEQRRRSFPLRGEVYEDIFALFECRQDERKSPEVEQMQNGARPRIAEVALLSKGLRRERIHGLLPDEAREGLAKFLFEKLCLDPAIALNRETLWYFPQLPETLAELYDIRSTAAEIAAPMTAIGAKVSEALDYAISERGLVFVDGKSRTGKTFAVKTWCDAHPGQVVYVQVPSSNDDMSFFRAMGEALGIGTSRAYKALELRGKIEAVLQTGDLLVVFDEGHYLIPQRNTRLAVPHRINWVLTQLVNMGVPVAVVTTPQFTKSQETIVKAGGWSSEQLIGRIMLYERLPDSLGEEDLVAVARHWLPGGEEKAIRALIAYAQSSEKYLQGVEALVRRSRFLAKKDNRTEPTFKDVAAALQEGVVPSDNALAAALSGARLASPRKGVRKPAVEVLQAPCSTAAHAVNDPRRPASRSMQPASDSTFTPPVRDTGDAVLSVPSGP